MSTSNRDTTMPSAWARPRDVMREPDAELIAVCDRWVELDRQVSDWAATAPHASDAEIEMATTAPWREQHELMPRLESLRATTPAGITARVRALASSNPIQPDGERASS